MSCLLQVSDPHFGTEQPEVLQALERLAHALAPQAVLLSGDITQRATRRQFAAARAFAERLAAPVVAIPGNHDIPLFQLAARLFAPYGRYTEAFGPDLEPVFACDDWLVVTVNTTRWYRHEDGEVSPAQIERVAARLAQASPRQVRVVVTHQPVLVTRPEDRQNRLHGRAAAVARWTAAGADLIVGGHIHLPFVRPLDERFPGCPPTAWAVQAGTAVSTRVRWDAPNSVNVLRTEASGDGAQRVCVVERWDHSATDKAFTRVDLLRLPLASRATAP